METKVDAYPHLYPPLHEGQPVSGTDYRLTQVARLRDQLMAEGAARAGLYKKYRRSVNILDGIDIWASATGVILGGVGTGLLVTIVAVPAVPIILGVAAGCGLASAGTKVATRRLRAKAQKHDQIRVLAESKLNSISDLVSKALEDGAISHDEFQTILSEVQKYHDMKKDIRVGAQKKSVELDEATKKELVERGRQEARLSFMQKIGVGSSP
jgi:hypothetical protein